MEDMADTGVDRYGSFSPTSGERVVLLSWSSPTSHEHCPTPLPIRPEAPRLLHLHERHSLHRARCWRNASAKIVVCASGGGCSPHSSQERHQKIQPQPRTRIGQRDLSPNWNRSTISLYDFHIIIIFTAGNRTYNLASFATLGA